MTRHFFLLFTYFAIIIARPAPAAEEKPLSRNAALIYWLAFDRLGELQADEKNGKERARLISEYDTAPLDEKVAELVRANEALELLHIAAALPTCDWGTGLLVKKQGPAVLLPHLGRGRALHRLALLRARWHLAEKRGGKAVEDLAAVYTMSRHLEQEGIAISLLVGHAIDSSANSFVAANLSSFSDADLALLKQKLAALPPHVKVSAVIQQERDGMGGWIRDQIESGDDKTLRELLRATGDPLAAPLLAATKEKLLEMVKGLEGFYDELIPLLDLPLEEFRQKVGAWSRKVADTDNPLGKMMLPAMATIREAQSRADANDLILLAGITYRLEGQDKFDAIKDPHGKGPFTMVKTETGFEVKSKLTVRGQEVVLKFKTK